MNKKYFITAGVALALVMVVAAQGSARMWGNNNGPMMGRGMMTGTMIGGQSNSYNQGHMMNGMRGGNMMDGFGYKNTTALTEDQKTAVNAIEEKYQADLTEKETTVRDKATELQTAQSDDATTFGEIKTLRNDLFTLEQDYWTLRNTVNQEISSTIGATYSGNMGWGADNYNWHNNQDMPGGVNHMYGQRSAMMGNGSSWCRW